MRGLGLAFLAGAACVVAGAALAQDARVVMVEMPGGVVVPVLAAPVMAEVPVAVPGQGFDAGPFAELERVSAMLDQQASQMLRQAAAMDGSGMAVAAPVRAASGSTGASYVAEFSSDGVCSRSVQISYSGDGAAPRVVSRQFGSCGAAARPGVGVKLQAPVLAPAAAPVRTIEAKAGDAKAGEAQAGAGLADARGQRIAMNLP